MVPVIFEVCNESDATIGVEHCLRIEWRDAPVVGESISMGGELRWEVVQVSVFKPAGADQKVESVYLAHINPAGKAVPDLWSAYDLQKDYPKQLFHIELSAVGEPQLSCGINVIGRKNHIGERLQDYVATSHPTRMRAVPLDWRIDSIEVYSPIAESPYTAIHLCWCIPIESPMGEARSKTIAA
jgi:hypothetical protein